VKFISALILLFLLTSAELITAFEAAAYIPHYRLEFFSGAENVLGRPTYNTEPNAWDGRTISDRSVKNLPESISTKDWNQRLAGGFDSFYLHIPLDSLFLTGESPDARHISYLKSIISETKISVYLSLIGSSSDFMPIVLSEKDLENFINRLVEISEVYELNGIDIDWEFPATPRTPERSALTLLAAGLREKLPDDVALSVAVSRWRLPDKNLFEIVDEIHLMAYDGYGRHATFESAVADAEIVITRFNQPADKLILGLPFYGRIFTTELDEYWKGTKNYGEIVRDYAPLPTEDEADGYFFNGPATISRKTDWALSRGLGGVFVWEPYYDVEGNASLISAIRQTIDDH
jgi:GH18 family chitinase